MADQGLFGSPVGDIAYDQNELTRAQTADKLADVAMAPIKRRVLNAQAEKLELDNQQEREFAALIKAAQGVSDSPTAPTKSMADSLDALARTAAGAGLITKATGLAKDASLIRQREATQANQAVQTQLNGFKATKERAELVGQLLGGVTDEQSWIRANALLEFQTGQPSPYAGLAYTPELVGRLNAAALSTKERMDLAERALTRKATATYRQARLDQIDVLTEIRQGRLDTDNAREERLAKAGGGKGASAPSKSELDQAARLITKDFGNMAAADANDAAFSIAAEARALRKANPALDANTALMQAFQAAKTAGDFAENGGVMGTGLRAKTIYSGRGRTAAAPAPMPTDRKTLTKGRYYQNALGQVAQWNGKGFVITRPLSVDNSRLGSEAADDDDEDDE